MKNQRLKVPTNLFEINQTFLNKLKSAKFYQIAVENLKWDKAEFYRLLRTIVESINRSRQGVTETAGFLLGVVADTREIDDIRLEFLEMLSKELRVKRDDISLMAVEKDKIITWKTGCNLLRLLVGRMITKELQSHGFQRIQSTGSCGTFLLPDIRQLDDEKLGNVKWILDVPPYGRVERVLEIDVVIATVTSQNTSSFPFFHATLELRTKLIGSQILSEELQELTITLAKIKDTEVKNKVLKELGVEKMNPKYKLLLPTGETAEGESFQLMDLLYDPSFKIKTTYHQYPDVELEDLLKNLGYDIDSVKKEAKGIVAVLKPKIRNGKKYSDPNKRLIFPTSILQKSLDTNTLSRTSYAKDYKEFSQIKSDQKKNIIEHVHERYEVLKKCFPQSVLLNSSKIEFATPTITASKRKFKSRFYGEIPRLSQHGVEEWGQLKQIYIYIDRKSLKHYQYDIISEFTSELRFVFNEICRQSGINRIPINIIDYKVVKDFRYLNGTPLVPGETCTVIMSNDPKIYKYFKVQLTHKREQAVQYVKYKTIRQMSKKNNGLKMLAESLARQIIAKTGGLPYRLSPDLLPRAAIIGLDRARDSVGNRPSASAGIAAVTPVGRYIAGTSTHVDSHSHDFIDVDKIGVPLVNELYERKMSGEFEIDTLVVLRDGAPDISRNEATQWKEIVKTKFQLIFASSRKTHPYRVFPTLLRRHLNQPVIFTEMPSSPMDFMTVTVMPPQGTPKPVLYTIMENTTDIELVKLKNKLGTLIVSLSLLCWESSTPTSQPLPLHYADKLAEFTALTGYPWDVTKKYPMFI